MILPAMNCASILCQQKEHTTKKEAILYTELVDQFHVIPSNCIHRGGESIRTVLTNFVTNYDHKNYLLFRSTRTSFQIGTVIGMNSNTIPVAINSAQVLLASASEFDRLPTKLANRSSANLEEFWTFCPPSCTGDLPPSRNCRHHKMTNSSRSGNDASTDAFPIHPSPIGATRELG